MSGQLARLILAGALAAAASPASATAGTVASELREHPCCPAYALSYTAEPGERNDLRISPVGEESIRVEDRAGIAPGPGCEADVTSGGRAAVCRFDRDNGLSLVSVRLGDRDDRASVEPASGDVAVHGGRGDDRLSSAGSAYNLFVGGAGDDEMSASVDAYSGVVFDEGVRPNGSDTMSASLNGTPLIAPPPVWVDYGDRREPVLVDLRGARNHGEAGEGDVLGNGVNGVRSGSGADRLIGDDADNALVGGGGTDVLSGRGGSDTLAARRHDPTLVLWPGADSLSRAATDRLSGGPGEDLLEGSDGANVLAGGSGPDVYRAAGGPDSIRDRDGYPDQIDCGAGSDRVRSDAIDFADRCERRPFRRRAAFPLSVFTVRIPSETNPCEVVPCRRRWLVETYVGCPSPPKPPCRGSVAIEIAGQSVGQGPFELDSGAHPDFVEFDVSEEALELVARLDPSVSVVTTSSNGNVVRVPLARMSRSAPPFLDIPRPTPFPRQTL